MKYAIWPGGQFFDKMLKASRTVSEKAVVMLLWRTGMHSSTLVNKAFNFGIHGEKRNHCYWKRPKTGKQLRAKLTKSEARLVIKCYRAGSLPATQGILRRWVRAIGDRAGYADEVVSPLTFRHSRAVYLLDGDEKAGKKPMPPHRVAHRMGCSLNVLEKHYSVIEDERGY